MVTQLPLVFTDTSNLIYFRDMITQGVEIQLDSVLRNVLQQLTEQNMVNFDQFLFKVIGFFFRALSGTVYSSSH